MLCIDDIQNVPLDDIYGVPVISFAAPTEGPRSLSFQCPVAVPRGGEKQTTMFWGEYCAHWNHTTPYVDAINVFALMMSTALP